jgi:hypothetical protein
MYDKFINAISKTVDECQEKGYAWGTFSILVIIAQMIAYYVFRPTPFAPDAAMPSASEGQGDNTPRR